MLDADCGERMNITYIANAVKKKPQKYQTVWICTPRRSSVGWKIPQRPLDVWMLFCESSLLFLPSLMRPCVCVCNKLCSIGFTLNTHCNSCKQVYCSTWTSGVPRMWLCLQCWARSICSNVFKFNRFERVCLLGVHPSHTYSPYISLSLFSRHPTSIVLF